MGALSRPRWRPGRLSAPGCAAVQEAVSARFDGERAELRPGETAAHVARCRSCRAFEAALALSGRMGTVHAVSAVPPELRSAVHRTYASGQGDGVGKARRTRHDVDWPHLARWGAAIAPAALVLTMIPLGAEAAPGRVTPALPPTSCTSYLLAHHLWTGYRAARPTPWRPPIPLTPGSR